ncbi:FAD-dependent monooxygenase [Streptomyces sp. NPDC048111]|uniref:FAD-dependent monooxygenase n=1 Tax=Streptomyces sp. NPDC048111 TaxID=3365500 RepID=UPI003724009F
MCGGRIAVVGGSIAGCAAALAAHRSGAGRITVYERASGRLADRGVGLAVHNDRYAELESHGFVTDSMPWLQLDRRGWYVRDGSSPMGRRIGTLPFPFRTYNWGPLWRELRARVPESVRFRTGTAVTRLHLAPEHVEVTTSGDECERFDLVVGADGYRSVVRAAAWPDVRPEYAGYLAWRGAFPVERLPDADRWPVRECAYAVFPGGHAVVYRIPDGHGGHRVNWVLYALPPTDHRLPLDSPTSIPPGALTAALREHVLEIADAHLPPFWARLAGLTPPGEMFVQPMYDFTAPRYATGRLVLIGDAATVARPHTGGGAVKALQDATALEAALTTAPDRAAALSAYDAERAAAGRGMVGLGRSLGHGLVRSGPDWSAMDQRGLENWWRRADGASAFGGRQLR